MALHPRALRPLLMLIAFASRDGYVVGSRMEDRFEQCCGLGGSWANEGLRCEKFTGPVSGVPRIEQALCLEAVDICCVRAYHEKQCELGKTEARSGVACSGSQNTPASRRGPRVSGDYHRDCCEGCKLGILTGSIGQGCAFNKFTFGNPWDPAFLECCHEALPSTTPIDTTWTEPSSTETSEDPTSSLAASRRTSTSNTWATGDAGTTGMTGTSRGTGSTETSGSSRTSETSGTSGSSGTSDTDKTSGTSGMTGAGTSDNDDSSYPTPPTPVLDDICELMKGMLCTEICVPTPGSYYCLCREGGELLEDGKTCRRNATDRCAGTNPCEQRCTDNGDVVKCSCDPGYDLADDGRSCTPATTEATTPSEDENELSPRCPPGYRYNDTTQLCDDVNECTELDSCPRENQVCVNTYGSYTCYELTEEKTCPAGFKYDVFSKSCTDVNECAENIHGCTIGEEECRNTEGGYECISTCRPGFQYSPISGNCIDVDECALDLSICGTGERCINTIGGHDCSPMCPMGFQPRISSKNDLQEEEFLAGKFEPCQGVEDCLCEPISESTCTGTNGSFVCDDPSSKTPTTTEDASRIETMIPEVEITTLENGYTTVATGTTDSIDVVGRDIVDEGVGTTTLVYDTTRPGGGTARGVAATTSVYRNIAPRVGSIPEIGSNTVESGTTALESGTARPEGGAARGVGATMSTRRNTAPSVGSIPEIGANTVESGTTTPRPDAAPPSAPTPPIVRIKPSRARSSNPRPRGPTQPRPTSRRVGDPSRSVWALPRLASSECPTGYSWDAATRRCIDVDECTRSPGCREYERCENRPGTYECVPLCRSGWLYRPATRSCQDVDECLLGRHDCPEGTHVCTNTEGSFVCTPLSACRPGYERVLNGSCVDVDECQDQELHRCRAQDHRYCVNRDGGYECVVRLPDCDRGYRYSLTTRECEDVDECATGRVTCDVRLGERCVNLPGSYTCKTPTPYWRQRQRQRPACPSGYRYEASWRQCIDVDECKEERNTCSAGEACYNQPGGYTCAKIPTPITRVPAASTRCGPGSRFVRNRGCVDVDECLETEEACSSNEECVNTPGSYTCTCKTGFRRDNLTRACVDINECQLQQNDCLPTQRCDNTLGSYTCIRFLPCGTGYTLNAATEICEDDDECILGTHDCSEGYHCRNTLGSYRCDRNPRGPSNAAVATTPSTTTARTTTTTPRTTKMPMAEPVVSAVTSRRVRPDFATPGVTCPRGFEPLSGNRCVDVDECQRSPRICPKPTERCVNTVGSYACVSRLICGQGYTLDPKDGQRCIDVDECAEKTHECGPRQTCENRQGGYACACPPGHVSGPNGDCVDIDECSFYSGQICSSNARCENTVGSYRCVCQDGFENVPGNGNACRDVDECEKTPGLCQHACVNTWGSYRCTCKPGFRLNPDNRSCVDVDECTEYKQNGLCVGICENTPGSYSCKCPDGYRLGIDGRTCQDVDECETGRVCRAPNEICQNTRGSFRCNRIDCPSGYYQDQERKNRCVRASRYCLSGDLSCLRSPSHYSYNFITFVSMLPVPPSGQLELFTMRGTHHSESTIRFSMALVAARAPPGVTRATESCFALRRPAPFQAILVLTRSIQGPQEVELDLSMEIYHNSMFAGSAVAKLLIYVSQYEF
ncbi:fibrillin-1 [Orussus abietinus]|uniref:fibrillin-1 n=1 Tax=Orussus abietinus TaxID=222816 RepID=UPI0006269F78|nr:fibrillin-1 [Orussus abietinus]